MYYQNVAIDTIAYVLPEQKIATRELESKLQPLYQRLRIPVGQLELMTGIRERRWWPSDYQVSDGAAAAARKALARSSVRAEELDILIYAGVCRDHFEPATACRVAALLGLSANAWVYDLSNACLGVLNGIVEIANRIELGQAACGMVVACEQAAAINLETIELLLREQSLELFKTSLATLTGGSGAVAVIVTEQRRQQGQSHRLLGGVVQNAAKHHELCRWGIEQVEGPLYAQRLNTDAVQVLQHGVTLGADTWDTFLDVMRWTRDDVNRVIMHQVGKGHRDAILKALQIPQEKDYSSFEFLGNMGTVSLPLTIALAEEAGFLRRGDRVGLLGIGSGLNCLMLGVEW